MYMAVELPQVLIDESLRFTVVLGEGAAMRICADKQLYRSSQWKTENCGVLQIGASSHVVEDWCLKTGAVSRGGNEQSMI